MHTTKALRSRFIATALFGLGVAGAAVVGTAFRSDGPPAFVLDYLLASDFFVWALARLAPNSLIRVAGIPRSLDSEISPEFRNKVVDWFFPAAARHVGLAYDIRTTTPIAPDLPMPPRHRLSRSRTILRRHVSWAGTLRTPDRPTLHEDRSRREPSETS